MVGYVERLGRREKRGWKRQVHASHDEYFVCTAVIFSTVFDVSIATYDVHTVQLLYVYTYIYMCVCVRVCARVCANYNCYSTTL